MPTPTEFDYIIHIPEHVKGAHAAIRTILSRVLQDTDRYDWSPGQRVYAINVEGLPQAVGGIYGLLMEGRFFDKGVDLKPAAQWATPVVVKRGTGRAAVDPDAISEPAVAPPGALALTAILVDEDGEIEVGDAHTAPAEPAAAPLPAEPSVEPLSPIARVEENRSALALALRGACTLSLHAEDGTRREIIVAPTRDKKWIATLVGRDSGEEVATSDHPYRLHAKLLALYAPESDASRAPVV